MTTMTGTLNQQNYDLGCSGYDAYITSQDSYNALVETPAMHQLLQTLAGTTILDFCCGTGRYANWMAADRPEARILGVDFSEQSIQVARERAIAQQLTNVQYLTGSFEMIAEQYCQHFDGIIWGMGLNYFEDIHGVFKALQTSLRSHGWVVCSLVHPLVWGGPDIQHNGQSGRGVFHYFTTTMQSHQWGQVTRTDGEPFVTRNYPYNFERLTAALSENGLYLDRILEPQPIAEGKTRSPDLYQQVSNRPQFAILKAVKKN